MSQRSWNRVVGALTKQREPVLSAVRASAKEGNIYFAGYLVLTRSRLVFFYAGLPSVKRTRDEGVFSVGVDKITGIEGRPVAGDATTKLSVIASGDEHSFLLRCSQLEAESFASALSAKRQGREPYGLLPLAKMKRFAADRNAWWTEIAIAGSISVLGGLLWLLSLQ